MRWLVLTATCSMVAMSCSTAGSSDASGSAAPTDGAATPPASSIPSTSPSTTIDDYPDLALRQFRARMNEPRLVAGSAMPPKHLNEEWFPTTLVDRNEIVSGGPPPDGIPAIDEPVFASISDVDDIEAREAVLVLEHGDTTRIYPVRIMIWHEIVNDSVDGVPISVTYCPLCNSALAYLREVDGHVLDFGTSGYLYRSGLVMYDRQSESLWTHFDGRAVVGTAMGTQLERLPVATVSWEQAVFAHPDALVLRGDPDDPKPYGTNRYVGYDQADGPLSGWFNAEIPDTLPPMTRVVGVRTDAGEWAVPTELVAERGVVSATIGSQAFVVFHEPGTASPLQDAFIGGGDDIGSTGVFDPTVDGRTLLFRRIGEVITDVESGSIWDIRGRAIVGPLVGSELDELEHLDTFWFAWVGHHPESRVVVPG